MKTVYPDVINKVLFICDQYIDGKCGPAKVQQVVAWAEYSVVNFEEKDLREFFTNIEGDIDSVRAMANGTDLGSEEAPEIENREKMLEIISKIKKKLNPE